MRYLQIVLTIIAFLLAVQVAARLVPAVTASSWQDVNIRAIGGKDLFIVGPSRDSIPVFITNK
jgi:hypothetical protein